MASEIVLVGAGRSSHTKQKRRRNGFPTRNRWIGTMQVRTGMRITVDVEFLQKNFDQVVEAVEDGVLLVEYKNDKYLDPEELKTLAFGSDEEKARYEEEASRTVEEQAAEHKRLADERREAERKAFEASLLGEVPPPAEEDALDEVPGEGGVATQEEMTEPDAPPEEPVPAEEPVSENEEPEVHDEGLEPANAGATRTDADFKPLPDGWRNYTKAELLALCEERGIDTADMPSNRELKRRLDLYQTQPSS